MIFLDLLPFAFLIGLVALVVTAVVRARRHGDAADDEPGIGTIRHLFLYGLAAVGLGIAAFGLATLVGGVASAIGGEVLAERRSRELAIGLALTLVGTPAWLALFVATQRAVARHSVESRMPSRWLYFGLVRGVALVVVMVSAIRVLGWAFRADSFEGGPCGSALVGGGVWLFHQRMTRLHPASADVWFLDRLYLHFGAVAGLVTLSGGAGIVLQQVLQRTYDQLFRGGVLVASPGAPLSDAARWGLAGVAVGATAWAWHWFVHTRRDSGSGLWRVYVFLFGILGGIATVVTAAAMVLGRALQWWFGQPQTASAARHFDLLPEAIVALFVGVSLWRYHRAAVAELPAALRERRTEAEWVYRYLATAAGLVTLASGLVALLMLAFEGAATSGLVHGTGWWRNRLVTGVTLLLVGAPLWAGYWFAAQREVARAGVQARAAVSRRVLIWGALGVSLLFALVDLSIALFLLFDRVLERTLSRATLHDARVSLALLLTSTAVAGYYWLVLREDQRATPAVAAAPPARTPVEVVLLVDGGGEALRVDLARWLDARVRLWRRVGGGAGPALSEAQVEALRARIAEAGHERLLAIVRADGSAEIVPFTVQEGDDR
ncbi:MAG: hypothetical protein EXR68_01775 [Dehalococcoidia bacterium]|nr:hypothetical protein [Dehalococcoidia bacterium]